MSERQPPTPWYPKTTASKLETEAVLLLSKRYSTFVPDVSLRQGGHEKGLLFGSLDGELQGHDGRWLVEVAASTNGLNSQRLRTIDRLYRELGEDRFDGALIIPGETPRNRPVLLERIQNHFPDFSIKVATLDELKATASFDEFDAEYPGPIAEIGHNSDAYHAAVEAIDAVSTQLRTSNTIELRADVRDRLLVEVQAGRTMLEATTIRIAALGNTIVPALKFIAENCAKVAVGELAKEALKWLVKLIFI